MSRFSYYKRRH